MMLTALGMNSGGQIVIAKPTDTLYSPFNLMGQGNTPSITLTAAAGVGATYSIIGTNLAGKITLNTGISLLASGKIMSLTFADNFSYPHDCYVNFTPGNANFANMQGKLYAVTTPTGVDLYTSIVPLSLSTTYIGYYLISG